MRLFIPHLFIFASVLSYGQVDTLREVVVTAGRFSQKQYDVGKSIVVLGDSLLRANEGKKLTDVLSQQVGVYVLGNGQPMGSNQGVFLRGASAGYTLILLDGIPVFDPSSIENNFDVNFISLSSISRIEIIKGSYSTLYGSDAVSGVINLITRKTTSEKPKVDFLLSAGNYATFKGFGAINGKIKKTIYRIQVGRDQSEGFSSAQSKKNDDSFDRDGFWKNTASLRLEQHFMPNFSIYAFSQWNYYKADVDEGAFLDDKDYSSKNKNYQWGFGSKYAFKKGDFVCNYSQNVIDRSYENDSADVNSLAFYRYTSAQYLTHSHFAEAYGNFWFNKNLHGLYGLEWRRQNTKQNSFYVSSFGSETPQPIEAYIYNTSAYSSLYWLVEKFSLEAGVRINRQKNDKTNITYSINPSYRWANQLKVFALVATAYKNPSLYQLFSIYGNANLKAETSQSFDVGFQFMNYIQISGFYRRIKNVVFFQSLASYPYGQYINQNEQKTHGVELSTKWNISKWDISAHYTYLNGKTIENTKESDLLRRPRHNVIFSAKYSPIAKLSLQGSFQWLSERKDAFFDAETFKSEFVTLKPYTLVGLSVHYKASTKLKFFADVQNILDANYTEIYGYKSKGINFQTGVLATF